MYSVVLYFTVMRFDPPFFFFFLSLGLESASYAFFLKMLPGVEKKHRRLVSLVRIN
jgi:hypothetical protein